MSLPAFAKRPALLLVFLAVIAAAAMANTPSRAERASSAKSVGSLCAEGIARQERALGIPRNLLAAISLAESGRWDDLNQEIVAWPWTVMAEGDGRFLATKAEAIAVVRGLQARGVTNIDVGCMQINLQHHPDAFATLEEAFDPAANTAYAARFLKSLWQDAGSWPLAAAHYHSRTPERANAYADKVRRLWAGLGNTDRHPRKVVTRLAQGTPGEESVFEDIFADRAAARKAMAPRRDAIIPIDYDRTAALNGRLRARRTGVADPNDGSPGLFLDAAAWQSDGMTPAAAAAAAAPRSLPSGLPQQLRARVGVDPVRSHDVDAFAVKRQEQLARWRRDGRF